MPEKVTIKNINSLNFEWILYICIISLMQTKSNWWMALMLKICCINNEMQKLKELMK